MIQRQHDHEVDDLVRRGFDKSYRDLLWSGNRVVYPRCSQCEVRVINGVASHETGCQNAMHECKGCSDLVPMRQTYCAVCR